MKVDSLWGCFSAPISNQLKIPLLSFANIPFTTNKYPPIEDDKEIGI